MASNRGDLVEERVKRFENVCVSKVPNVTLCPRIPADLYCNVTTDKLKTQKDSTRHTSALRPAPAVPLQRRAWTATSASASPINAELDVPLLHSTTGNHATGSKMVSGVPGSPTRIDAVPLLGSGHATELSQKAELTGIKNTGQQEQGRSFISWITIRDNCSAAASRFQNTMPTKRTEFKLCLLVLLGFLGFLLVFFRGFNVRHDVTKYNELDEYFHDLSYNADELLAYQGETLKVIQKEGILKENRCIIIEKRRKSLSNGKSDIGVVASNEHLTYPGSLLLANHRLVDNSPDLLVVDRAPLTYTVNLPGLTTEGSFTIVPSFSEFQSAVNKVINTWFEKYPDDRSTVANFQSIESFAYSKELLRAKFGLDFLNSLIEDNIDFNAMRKGEKLIKIYKFTQVFYTVSVEPTKKPSDLFNSELSLKEIKQKTDEKNPPVLVDSVSYGRNIYVKIETSSVEKHAELNLAILDTKNGFGYAIGLQNLDIQVYVVGGNTDQTKLIYAREADEVPNIIRKFSMFSKHNLGFPILYTSRFIKDNQKAVVHYSTDYVESLRHNNCQKGIIKLVQQVWFVKWEVTWTEISYDENGNEFTVKKEWDNNCKVITLAFESEDIEISGYVEDLKVVAKVLTLFDSWRTVINRRYIPIIPRREFHVTGRSSSEIIPPIPESD